jgi:hypothetical protein
VPDDTGYFRVPGWLRQQAGLGRIGVDARAPARTAYGLAIENIERAYLMEIFKRDAISAAHYTDTAPSATYIDIDSTYLSWRVWTSGRRPVEVGFSLIGGVSAAGTTGQWSMTWDGVEVTGLSNGMAYMDYVGNTQLVGVAPIPAPSGGEHTLRLVWKGTGAGTITTYAFGGSGVTVWCKEV